MVCSIFITFLDGDDTGPTYFCSWLRVKSAINVWVRLSQIGKLKAPASFTISMAWAGLPDAFALPINSFSNSLL